MNGVKSFFYERRFYFIGFGIIFLFTVLVSLKVDLAKGYDNWWYWWVYEPYFNGHRVGAGELEVWRGYFFPSVCAVLNTLGKGRYTYYTLLISLLNSFCFMTVLPSVFGDSLCVDEENKTPKKIFISLVVFSILFSLYAGLFYYTFSHLFALYMILISIFFIKKAFINNKFFMLLLFWGGAGCFAAFSYYTRTIYIFGVWGEIVLFLVWYAKSKFVFFKKALCLFSFIIAFFIIGIPQSVLNYKHDVRNGVGSPCFSIFVEQSLMHSALYTGLKHQRYDTYIPLDVDSPELDKPQMEYPEYVGKRLLEIEGRYDSYKQFIKHYILKYPFEYIGICMRHLMNMAFPCYPTQYVFRPNNNKLPYAVISLIVLYSFILVPVLKCMKSMFPYLLSVPIFLTCFFISPSGFEVDYMVGFFFVMASTLCFNVDFKQLALKIKANWVSVLVTFLLFSAVMISQWTLCLMSNSEIPIFMLGK